MSRLSKRGVARLIRFIALAVCAYCMVIPAAPLSRVLSERPAESEERSEKADSTEQEFGIERPRDFRLITSIALPAHTHKSDGIQPGRILTASQHPATHSDRDLRNGFGAALLT